VNGLPLTERQLRALPVRLPDGDYWYDRSCGAFGRWKGPIAGFLRPGLDLGGPMTRDCSGGGTGVFVNGRELHPLDLLVLSRIVGTLRPGHYRLSARGILGSAA